MRAENISELYNVLFLVPVIYIALYPETINKLNPADAKFFGEALLFIWVMYHVYKLTYYLKKN